MDSSEKYFVAQYQTKIKKFGVPMAKLSSYISLTVTQVAQ